MTKADRADVSPTTETPTILPVTIGEKVDIARDLDERLARCFSSVFPDLAPEQIHTTSLESVRGWDSLTSVTLLAVVQEEFGVLTDFSELVSYETLRNFIWSHSRVA